MLKKLSTRDMVFISLFTALIAIGAFIQIPLPNSDYFTLQFLFVILSGLILGPSLGATSVLVYLFIGLIGVPIFAAGGGLTYVLRPTFGYLIGFVFCSYVTGKFSVNKSNTFKNNFIAGMIGFLVVYIIGFTYKYLILNLYMGTKIPMLVIFLSAFPVDIPGDILGTILASLIGVKLKKILKYN